RISRAESRCKRLVDECDRRRFSHVFGSKLPACKKRNACCSKETCADGIRSELRYFVGCGVVSAVNDQAILTPCFLFENRTDHARGFDSRKGVEARKDAPVEFRRSRVQPLKSSWVDSHGQEPVCLHARVFPLNCQKAAQ